MTRKENVLRRTTDRVWICSLSSGDNLKLVYFYIRKNNTERLRRIFSCVKAIYKATLRVTTARTATTGSHLFVCEVGLSSSQEEHVGKQWHGGILGYLHTSHRRYFEGHSSGRLARLHMHTRSGNPWAAQGTNTPCYNATGPRMQTGCGKNACDKPRNISMTGRFLKNVIVVS